MIKFKMPFRVPYAPDAKFTKQQYWSAEAKMPKQKKTAVIKRISKYLLEHKFLVIVCFVLMITSNTLALAAPKLSQGAIDAIEPGIKPGGRVDIDTVMKYAGLMIAFYIISAMLSYILAALIIRLSKSITYRMRRELFNHLIELPVSYFDTHASGEIISRISYDVDTVNSSLSHDLLQICTSVITVVGSIAVMLTISPFLLECVHTN